MNRRTMLKLLSLAPLGLALPRSGAILKTFGDPPPSDPVKIFLHGFFFIDVQEKGVVVAAPSYPKHHFLFRSDGDTQFTDIPMSVVDLQTNIHTSATARPQWPKGIFNFKKSVVGLDPQALASVWSNTLGCLLLLPWPDRIVQHRDGGVLTDVIFGGNVGKAIQSSCDQKLWLSISLEYDNATGFPFQKRHYYAEHCDIPNDDEIADMLDTAKHAFGTKFEQNFDLQMTHIPTTTATTTSDPDDQTLGEISGMQNNPCPHLSGAQKASRDKLIASLSEEQRARIFTVRTANCPMFGMI